MNRERIQWKDSKASDIHGVICETTKHATSTVGICEFVDVWGNVYTPGSFRFNSDESNKNTDIKCFQQVKPGFEVKNIPESWFINKAFIGDHGVTFKSRSRSFTVRVLR